MVLLASSPEIQLTISGNQLARTQFLLSPDNECIRCHILRQHVERDEGCNAQSLALANRVKSQSLMLAQGFPVAMLGWDRDCQSPGHCGEGIHDNPPRPGNTNPGCLNGWRWADQRSPARLRISGLEYSPTGKRAFANFSCVKTCST